MQQTLSSTQLKRVMYACYICVLVFITVETNFASRPNCGLFDLFILSY